MRFRIFFIVAFAALLSVYVTSAQTNCCIYIPLVRQPDITPTFTIEPTAIIPSPSPSPTSEPTVTPDPTVKVLSSTAFVPFSGSTSLYIVGEVRNDTDTTVQFVRLNAVLRSTTGQIVDGSESFSYIDKLNPGMRSPFRIIFSNAPTWASYEITVTWSTATTGPIALEARNLETYFDSSNAYHVKGTIRNTTGQARTFVKVFLTVYGTGNKVIGAEYTFTNPTTLQPDQEVPFDIDAFFWDGKPDRSKIIGYSLQSYDD